ncbi:MAG: CDP-alcohol phosphatidyltransferase family protein [Planctomycetes bacterium]|nr:CDP-alcohol phosphatidyltransferase family protein [Planctomycetota bacterium]
MRLRRAAGHAAGAARRRFRRLSGVARLAVLPNLVTLGNLICGFAALTRAAKGDFAGAGWFILLGMVFDTLDGQIARLARATSDFGGQLDSFCDAVTFGVAPAMVVALSNQGEAGSPLLWPRMVWFFSLTYAVCAVLRLVRFNLENSRGDEAHHTFRGIPSPGAAGAVASTVILAGWLSSDPNVAGLVPASTLELASAALGRSLPFMALALGCLMVSRRVRYVHVPNRYFRGRRRFDTIADLVVLALLVAVIPHLTLFLGFAGYALSGPVLALRGALGGATAPVAASATPADPAGPAGPAGPEVLPPGRPS